MDTTEVKTKDIISTIVSPFATASVVLLFILSFVEYFRRGFVSLFLDFRILVAVTLVLYVVSVITKTNKKDGWFSKITIALLVVSCLPVFWKMTQPFGRLGLITFGCGAAVLVLIIASCTKLNKEEDIKLVE